MTKSDQKILIRVIGNKANDSVIQFLKEKSGIKKLYIIHKVTQEPDFYNPKEIIDFENISKNFIKKLNKDWNEVEVIPKILKDSQDFYEIQKIVREIVNSERISSGGNFNSLQEIAIDISGGTGIGVAGQLFAAFKQRITPYHVQPKTVRKTERVTKIIINYRMGSELGKPDSAANQILKNLAESEFKVRTWDGNTFSDTPDGYDEKSVYGMKTQLELNREFAALNIRRIDTHLRELIRKNMIEEGSGLEVYKNKADDDEEADWILDELPNKKYYRITEAGQDEYNMNTYGVG
jgi:hypothetical protein